MAQNFDVYNDKDEKVATNQPSPVSISGLNPVTKYSGYKIAYAGKDEKTTIDDFTTTNQVPGKPSLTINAGDGKLNVTFSDGQNIGTAVTKRTVYWKTADGHNGTTDFGTSLTGSVDNLTNGTEYTLQGVCTNAAGDSEKSDEAKGTPVAPAQTTPSSSSTTNPS